MSENRDVEDGSSTLVCHYTNISVPVKEHASQYNFR